MACTRSCSTRDIQVVGTCGVSGWLTEESIVALTVRHDGSLCAGHFMGQIMHPVLLVSEVDALDALYIALGILAGGLGAFIVISIFSTKSIKLAREESAKLIDSAQKEAETTAHRLELDSEKKASQRRESLDRELKEARSEFKNQQDRVNKREEKLDRKFDQLSNRESKLEEKENNLQSIEQEKQSQLENLKSQSEELKARLSEIASLSREDARKILLQETREEVIHDAAKIEQEIYEEAEERARERSREITLMAIQRYAAEHVADSTVRTVKIPSDDMKGRIIGREGRNIRAIERATGADILVDDTPGVISVSCFDRVRQAIAAESLQKLVADGRVHPSRVEEIVAQTKRDIEERIRKHGQDAVVEANIRGVHPKVVEAMGKLHFRTSYGQNVLRHSIEVAFLSQIIADQLGLDGQIARRCGFSPRHRQGDGPRDGRWPSSHRHGLCSKVRGEIPRSPQRHWRTP